MNYLSELLSTNPIFSQLTITQQTIMAVCGSPRRFEKDEIITPIGEVWPYLFMVVHGKVNALKESSEGRRLIVETLQTGDVFWGIAFFNSGIPTPIMLEGREAGQLVSWSQSELLPILQENPHGLWELCRLIAARMTRASHIIDGLAFQPVASRLARLMLDLFGDEVSVPRTLTLEEMAALVGSTREMVCRTLYRFADKKLIEVTRTDLVLTNKTGLARLANEVLH